MDTARKIPIMSANRSAFLSSVFRHVTAQEYDCQLVVDGKKKLFYNFPLARGFHLI